MVTIADSLREEGKLEGLREGTQKGKREGKLERNIEIAKNLLLKGLDVAFICEVTGMKPEQVQAVRNQNGPLGST